MAADFECTVVHKRTIKGGHVVVLNEKTKSTESQPEMVQAGNTAKLLLTNNNIKEVNI